MSERVVTEPAPAKLNPFLRVLGRRPDGYHDIETLVLPLSLKDQVSVSLRDEGFGLRVVGPRADEVSHSEDNLVVRAARKLAEVTGERRGANILLHKTIPVAAGLGGGSSNAAATLRALGELWGLGLELERLAEIGASVGSDVPALVHRRPVLARGRGEPVEPIDAQEMWWVVVALGFPVSAQDAYRWWDRDRRWRRARTGPEPGPIIDALRQGDIEQVGALLSNDLEAPVTRRHPEVGSAMESIFEVRTPGHGGRLILSDDRPVAGVAMVGSGPSVVGLFRDAEWARSISQAFRREWPGTFVCRA